MTTFAVGYGLVWLAVLAYVARLGVQQRRLAREVEALKESQAARPAPLKIARVA